MFALGAVSCTSSYCIVNTFYQMRRTGLYHSNKERLNITYNCRSEDEILRNDERVLSRAATVLGFPPAVRICQAIPILFHSMNRCSVGQTTNLMSIDADKLSMASQFFHFLWYCVNVLYFVSNNFLRHGPLATIAVMIILCFEVGPIASAAGLLFLFTSLPLQHYVANKIGMLQF